MNALPETTEGDLYVMGITPSMIKEALEKDGNVIQGEIVGFFLPKDNHHGDRLIRRARNHLRSDWRLVAQRPSIAVKEERYDESFSNFDGNKNTVFRFNRSVTNTSSDEYTLIKDFGVTVNGSIQLGIPPNGVLLGFTSSESEKQVQGHSTSTATTHRVEFDVEVPAGEGRTVSTVTTRTSTDKIYRALLGVQGTVGIEVDPGWYRCNRHWWMYDIGNAFPNATASREILRTSIDTKVDNVIRRSHEIGDILECRIVINPQPDPKAALLSPSLGANRVENIGIKAAPNLETESPSSPTFTAELVVEIDFSDTPPIDFKDRLSQVTTLQTKLQAEMQSTGREGIIGEVTWQPNAEKMTQATFTIPYDPTRITRDGLIEQFVQLKRTVAWNESHRINFV